MTLAGGDKTTDLVIDASSIMMMRVDLIVMIEIFWRMIMIAMTAVIVTDAVIDVDMGMVLI